MYVEGTPTILYQKLLGIKTKISTIFSISRPINPILRIFNITMHSEHMANIYQNMMKKNHTKMVVCFLAYLVQTWTKVGHLSYRP